MTAQNAISRNAPYSHSPRNEKARAAGVAINRRARKEIDGQAKRNHLVILSPWCSEKHPNRTEFWPAIDDVDACEIRGETSPPSAERRERSWKFQKIPASRLFVRQTRWTSSANRKRALAEPGPTAFQSWSSRFRGGGAKSVRRLAIVWLPRLRKGSLVPIEPVNQKLA